MPRQACCPILEVGGFLEEGTSKPSEADSTAKSCVTRPWRRHRPTAGTPPFC